MTTISVVTNVEAFNWNVVIVGHWNRAILTPAGIAYRLFKLPKDTPVQIEVPLDGLAPYRVKHGPVVITAQSAKLNIFTESPSYENLQIALQIASTALNDLPETPVQAAGFNICYRIENIPEVILGYIKSEMDEALSDEGYQISTRVLRRSIQWHQGHINIEVSCDEQSLGIVSLNFEMESGNTKDLITWVNTPIEQIKKTATDIFEKVLMLAIQEVNNEKSD